MVEEVTLSATQWIETAAAILPDVYGAHFEGGHRACG